MKVYAISDLHISTNSDKPMDVFGPSWVGYMDKIKADWQKKVGEDDVVLIAGDISWAMKIDDAKSDFDVIKDLNGKKIFIKGNHDYWWSGIGKVRDILPKNCFAIQNDALKIGNVVFCGSRGWNVPGSPDFRKDDMKIYQREAERFKMSLEAAKGLAADGDVIIALIHFPPFNSKKEDTAFTRLFEEYGVHSVIYGHLHGKYVHAEKLAVKNGINYYLTSCDMAGNKLTEIVL